MRRFAIPSFALVRRELLATLRGNRAVYLVAASLLAFSVLAVANWPVGETDMSSAVYYANQLAMVTLSALFIGSLLIVPAFSSGAIVLEREQESFDMLSLTLIRPSGIILGKLLNAVGFYFLLFIACIPVASTPLFLAGVELEQVVGAGVVILFTTVAAAMVGILSSTFFRSSFVAIGGAYVGTFLFLFGPIFVVFITLMVFTGFGFYGSVGYWLERTFTVISPVGTVVAVMSNRLQYDDYTLALLYQVFVIVVAFRLTRRRLMRPLPPRKVDTEKPIDDSAVLAARRKSFPFYLIDPLKRKKYVEDDRNPMLVREIRWGLFNRGSLIVRVTYVAFGVYFFSGAIAMFGGGAFENMAAWMIAQMVVTVLIAPGLVSNSLTKEYELGNVDMLRMTLLDGRQIVLGKLYAAFVGVTPVVCAAVLSAVPILLYVQDREWGLLTVGYITIVACAVMSVSLAMCSSLFTKRTNVALTLSYFVNGFFFAGLPLISWWAWDYFFGVALAGTEGAIDQTLDAGSILLFSSPIFAFGMTMGGDEISLTYWLRSLIGTLAFSAGLVVFSVVFFTRRRMRDR